MCSKILEGINVDKQYLDTNNWLTVNTSSFDAMSSDEFEKRKEAILMYLHSNASIQEIRDKTGVSKSSLYRLLRRCFETDNEGMMFGFRGLIPQKRVTEYKLNIDIRTISLDSIQNKAGIFALFLDKYPSIKELIKQLYLNNDKRSAREYIMKGKFIHIKFIEACRLAGIKANEYPFITKDLAKRSLNRYLKNIEQIYFLDAAKRYGEDAERQIKATGTGEKNRPMIVKPFEQVQFDGHRIDAIFSITFLSPEGDEITAILDRVWLLVLIDVATRDVLGYHLSLNKEYNAADVLHCIRNAVMPKQVMEFTIPGLKYPDNYGYHSLAIPTTEWALWDELCYDNGKANLSNIVRDRLKRIIGCSINPGPVNLPERREIIERFFGILEENGYHRLPNTTGSNSKDPNRNEPEKNAIKYQISLTHLEELTELLIAKYNNEPHSGINYMTPLECMEQRIVRGMSPRILSEEHRNDVTFLTCQVQRTIQGSFKNGKRPYINFEGVEYRNDVLSRSPGLVGKKLDLLVNIDDIRVLKAYLEDGSEFGYLTATGKWGVSPHSLQMRKQINKLQAKKLIFVTSTDDPIEIYKAFLQKNAMKTRSARNKYVDLDKKSKAQMKSSKDNHDVADIKNKFHEEEKMERNIKSETDNVLNMNRNKFKTFTY